MPDSALPQSVVEWLAGRTQAVLITNRADGSAQSSNIAFRFDPADRSLRISVTDDRAKTRNLRRDPRATLHVLGDSFWSYLSLACSASLSPVSTEPGDAVGTELLEVYEAISGKPHPDPAEYFQAMVNDKRLVITLHPLSYAGAGLPD